MMNVSTLSEEPRVLIVITIGFKSHRDSNMRFDLVVSVCFDLERVLEIKIPVRRSHSMDKNSTPSVGYEHPCQKRCVSVSLSSVGRQAVINILRSITKNQIVDVGIFHRHMTILV